MTDIPVGGFVVGESGWSRFKNQIGAGFRAIGRGLRTAAIAIWNGTKATASFLWRGATKVLGLTGTSIGWLVGIVLSGAIMLGVAAMWLALTAATGVVWLVRWAYGLFDTYVVGVFRYLARKDRTATFEMVNMYRTSSVTVGLGVWYATLLSLRGRLETFGAPTDGDIETLVKEAEANGIKLTEDEGEIIVKANAEAMSVDEALVQEALRVKAEQELAEHPDFIAMDRDAINENPVIDAISKFVGPDSEGVMHTRVEFDFTPFISASGKNHVALQAFEWLRDDATDKAERSYWAGRYSALDHFERVKDLDKFPQEWSKVAKRIQREVNSLYRVTEGRTGFNDMVKELRVKQQAGTRRGQKR